MNSKKQILIFLIITFILSYALQFYIILNGGIKNFGPGILVGLMWIPGLVSLIIRLKNKDFSDIGLKPGGVKYNGLAFFIPMLGALISFILCSFIDIRIMGLPDGVPYSKVLKQSIMLFLLGYGSALGEELGWRGYLVPKIYQTNWKFPTLIVGLIWVLWHIPIVAFSGYYQTLNPWIVILLYSSAILGFNYFICWIRMKSGSMWSATLTHASYNFFFQTFWLHFLFKTPGKNVELWEIIGGDVGVLPILIFLAISLYGHIKLKWDLTQEVGL